MPNVHVLHMGLTVDSKCIYLFLQYIEVLYAVMFWESAESHVPGRAPQDRQCLCGVSPQPAATC